MDVTTKVAEPSCHFEGDGKKDLTVGAWLFMCGYQFIRCSNILMQFFQNLHTPFDISFNRHYGRRIHVAKRKWLIFILYHLNLCIIY
jgi:hypothetical protein